MCRLRQIRIDHGRHQHCHRSRYTDTSFAVGMAAENFTDKENADKYHFRGWLLVSIALSSHEKRPRTLLHPSGIQIFHLTSSFLMYVDRHANMGNDL